MNARQVSFKSWVYPALRSARPFDVITERIL
jgi:hypothetical protein